MSSEAINTGLLTTIGYGDRPWEEFVLRLHRNRIRYLIDVRSQARSRQPEFNSDALEILLAKEEIKYVYMGDSLGGKPRDPSCYVEGKIDYLRCQERPVFKAGLARLQSSVAGGHRSALMCSELDPEKCHRSKMIGEALIKDGVELSHIDRDGSLISQRDVIARLTKGQGELFGQAFTSVGRYEVAPPDGIY
tara:strand:+ start:1058 stop:1633 length:576 start_codon:yes stop_codon:yes gene_type:complete